MGGGGGGGGGLHAMPLGQQGQHHHHAGAGTGGGGWGGGGLGGGLGGGGGLDPDTGSFSAHAQTSQPQQQLCPLTHSAMADPVIACDGLTYERQAITEWMMDGHETSPVTGQRMHHALEPNYQLRAQLPGAWPS
jgi:hypothetical protein